VLDLPATEQPAIVVTASRAEELADRTPASVTLIDSIEIERIGLPQVADFLRLVPSVAVATSGPAGSQTQVRIRGAEANHTLLYVEGIRANDPAAGNEPRFELLNADLASQIEVVRGPQSALWGSEAIGGVVAVAGAKPGSGGTIASAEGGSRETWRGAARSSFGNEDRGLSLGIAGQGSDGIDSFVGGGTRTAIPTSGCAAPGGIASVRNSFSGHRDLRSRGRASSTGIMSSSFAMIRWTRAATGWGLHGSSPNMASEMKVTRLLPPACLRRRTAIMSGTTSSTAPLRAGGR